MSGIEVTCYRRASHLDDILGNGISGLETPGKSIRVINYLDLLMIWHRKRHFQADFWPLQSRDPAIPQIFLYGSMKLLLWPWFLFFLIVCFWWSFKLDEITYSLQKKQGAHTNPLLCVRSLQNRRRFQVLEWSSARLSSRFHGFHRWNITQTQIVLIFVASGPAPWTCGQLLLSGRDNTQSEPQKGNSQIFASSNLRVSYFQSKTVQSGMLRTRNSWKSMTSSTNSCPGCRT